MATSLTAAQLISIATFNATPPWRVSSLAKHWGTAGKPLSLKSALARFESTTTVFILGIRNLSIVAASNSLAEFQANLRTSNMAWVPDRPTLTNFIQYLGTKGISVHGVSADWQTIVVSGPAPSFSALPCVVLSSAGAGPPSGGTASDKKIERDAPRDSGGGLLPTTGWGKIATAGGGVVVYVVGQTPIGKAIIVGGTAGYYAGDGLYDLTKPSGGQSPNPDFGVYAPNGDWVMIPPGPMAVADAGAAANQVTSSPPVTTADIPYGPPSPPQSDTTPSASDFGTGVETVSKQGKEVTDKDKDGIKDNKEGKEDKEGKEATDKDKDGTKEGKESAKDEKEGKEVSDKLKEGKDGKDEKDGKEGTDKSKEGKDGKEVADGGDFGDDIRQGGPAPGAPHPPSPAPAGDTKPTSLLTRSPLV